MNIMRDTEKELDAASERCYELLRAATDDSLSFHTEEYRWKPWRQLPQEERQRLQSVFVHIATTEEAFRPAAVEGRCMQIDLLAGPPNFKHGFEVGDRVIDMTDGRRPGIVSEVLPDKVTVQQGKYWHATFEGLALYALAIDRDPQPLPFSVQALPN
jgi:hypothetical protein